MDIRHRFSENSWPLVESWIQESIEEFTRRRLQPPEGSSAQYPDSPGNRTSSFAQETRVRPSTFSARMPQNALNDLRSRGIELESFSSNIAQIDEIEAHNPTRVQGRVFTFPSFGNEILHEHLPNRVQHCGRGNETTDSAYFTTFNPTNPSSRTGTGFPEDEPGAIDDMEMFKLFFDVPNEHLANPSGAQEHPDLLDLDLGGVGSTPCRSQQRQNRY